jgi:hypothetical protein
VCSNEDILATASVLSATARTIIGISVTNQYDYTLSPTLTLTLSELVDASASRLMSGSVPDSTKCYSSPSSSSCCPSWHTKQH